MNGATSLFEFSIPAADEAADRACLSLRSALHARLTASLAAARIFGIELVAREAVQNAVDYGCGRDALRRVCMSARAEGDTLTLTVSDDGPGFDADAAIERELRTEPGTSENGLRIISAYADRYRYENGGRTLVAEFVIGKENVMQEIPSNGMWSPKMDLVAANVKSVKEDLRNLVAGSEGEFVVDLSSVAMIDSKGLGLLIATVNSLEPSGRMLRVIGAKEDLVELFKMMRLDRHLTIA